MELLIICLICYILYKIINPTHVNDEVINNSSKLNNIPDVQRESLLDEERVYIMENIDKRLSLRGWLISDIHSTLLLKWVIHITTSFIFLAFLPNTIIFSLLIPAILIIDFWFYFRKILIEVTVENPEYMEKYSNLHKK